MCKKIFGIILSLSCVLSMAACSGGESSSSLESSSSSSSSSVPSSSSSVSSSSSSAVSSEPEKLDISKIDNTKKVTDAIKINDDVGAYLYIPDTKVDTPLLDSSKNYEKPYEMINAYYNRYEEIEENGEKKQKHLSNLNWEKKEVGEYGASSPYMYSKPVYSSREALSPNLAILGYNIGVLEPSNYEKALDALHEIPDEEYDKLKSWERRSLYLKEAGVNDYPDGPEFAQLFHYLDEEFVKNHPYVFLSTETDNFIYEIFAVSYLEAQPEFRYYSSKISQEDAYGVAKQAIDHSIWLYPEVEIKADDKIISLSTTPYSYFEDGYDNERIRFVITGRLLPADAELKETCKVEKNPSPVAPVLPERPDK